MYKAVQIAIVALPITLIHCQPAAAQSKLVKSTVAYREVDGHEVLADVYRASGDDRLPVIVWIHGGALIMGHREGIHPKVRSLAEDKGYALVSIDYRLAPETKLPAIIGDIEAAFRWLGDAGAKQFNLDPERIVVIGGSAGGYLSLITGYRVSPRPTALVALYGYGDLTGDWYSSPSPHARHNPRKVSRTEAEKQTDGSIVSDARRRKGDGGLIYLHYRQRGIWPREVSGFRAEEMSKRIAPFEPVRNVTANFPATLLIHGTNDTDVPYQQSVMMAEQLKKHGVQHLLETVPNAEHGFRGANRDDVDDAYKAMRKFVVKHLEDANARPAD